MLEDFDRPRSSRRRLRASGAGPWTTGLVLVGVIVVGLAAHPKAADVTDYFRAVEGRIHGIPYTLGSWVGRDVVVVPEARELLRPNAVLQRRYTRVEDDLWFDVIVVHCGDVRDMQGHYPPVCYPQAGWEIEAGVPTLAGVGPSGVAATEYRVTHRFNRSVPTMRIVNFFAMPGDGVQYARDMDALEVAARSSARAQQGVLQVQVLTPLTMDDSVRDATMSRVWSILEPTVREVVRGPNADR